MTATKLNLKALAIDAMLLAFAAGGAYWLHSQHIHPKPAVAVTAPPVPAVQVTPDPPLPTPKPVPDIAPAGVPKAAHKVAEVKEKRPSCDKAKSMAAKYGLDKDNFEGPARDYGLNMSQIAFVRKCLGG